MTLDKRFLEDVARALPTQDSRRLAWERLTGQKSGLKGTVGLAFEGAAELKGATAAGIASPLVEPDAAAREYHSDTVIVSADGLFEFAVKPIKRVYLQDANGAEVVLEFDVPS
jgi:hypothetical protein